MEAFHKVEWSEVTRVSEMVGRAFDGYPFLRALFGRSDVSPELLGEYFNVIMKATFKDALAFSSDETLKDLLFIFPPGKYNMKLSTAIACGGLKMFSWLTPKIVVSSLKYDSTCVKCRKIHDADNTYYVYIFAVEPELQGNGRGSKIMKPLVEWAENTGNSLYLETHKENNITLYEHFGFELVARDVMHTGDLQYPMLYRPKQQK